jgi:phosphodiesterase/alkaline phosphatase D-like protein
MICSLRDLRFARHSTGALDMKSTTLRTLTMVLFVTVMASLLVRPHSAYAYQNLGAAYASANPAIESVSDTLAFITWTTPNPGGTVLHYAIVRYGKDQNHLEFTAKSPTRINPSHSEMIFRVRMDGLQPGTTYYYKVSSEQATGISDPATSGVNQLTTRPAN